MASLSQIIQPSNVLTASNTKTINSQSLLGSGNITITGGATIADITTNGTYYPTFTTTTSGTMTDASITTTKLTFNPSTGVLSSTLFNSTSDVNKKDNVVTASGALVEQLRGVEFTWKESGEKSSGVIAQEVKEVLPHLVGSDENGLNVNYNGLVAYLIEAVKELKAEVKSLKGE